MKEVLFRGRRKRNGEWVYGFYYIKRCKFSGDSSFFGKERHIITTGIEVLSGAYGEKSRMLEFEVDPETVGQFTGRVDKDGNEIFDNLYKRKGKRKGKRNDKAAED